MFSLSCEPLSPPSLSWSLIQSGCGITGIGRMDGRMWKAPQCPPPPSPLIPPWLHSVCGSDGQQAEGLPENILFLLWSRTQHYGLANRWLDHLTLFYFKQYVLARFIRRDTELLLQGSSELTLLFCLPNTLPE